jgi:hypothetical protein
MDKLFKLGLALAAAFAVFTTSPPKAQATAAFFGEYYVDGITVFGTGTTTNYAAISFNAQGTGFNTTCDDMRNVLYIDLSTIRGRAMLSTVTAAMMAHTQVVAIGSNTCISTAITLPALLLRSETINWVFTGGS